MTNLSSSSAAGCGSCDWSRLGGFALGVTLMALFWVLSVTGEQKPRLVGVGCVGASGPLYAFEEDHFPKCQSIEVWQ